MTLSRLYLELLDSLFTLKGWSSKTIAEVNKHREEADMFLFQLLAEGIDDREMGIIMKEIKTKKIESLESFLKFPAFFIEGIKILTIMQVSNNITEFISLNKRRRKNSKPSKGHEDFDKVLLALMKVPKSSLVDKKKDKGAK